MIKEVYCSYEVSKLLKEKGFVGSSFAYYSEFDDWKILRFWRKYARNPINTFYLCAPTHQMACAWLREKYHIHANPIKQGNYDDCSDYYTWIVASNGIIYKNQSVADKLSYEDAVEAALKYVLENLI